MNNCIILSAVTNININHVNNDKYAMNLCICGSSFIYSVEYICTNHDILVTTTIIIAVNPSYCNPISPNTHVHIFIYVPALCITTSSYIFNPVTHVTPINITVALLTPSRPIARPINPAIPALINGTHNTIKYINARRDSNPRLIT